MLTGVKRVVLASSAAIYGETGGKVDETYPCRPLSIYGYTKLLAETLLEAYTRLYGLRGLSLRLFNVFGERIGEVKHPDVVTAFIAAAMSGGSLRIYGDGSQTRDFVYVGDVIQAMMKAVEYLQNSKGYEVMNIGSGRSTTVKRLAETVMKAYSLPAERLRHEDWRPGDIRHSLADISKAQKTLGYSPTVSIEEWLIKLPHAESQRMV